MEDTGLFLSDYRQLREALKGEYPEIWQVVVELCASVPLVTDKSSFWVAARNKPCYSNIKVAQGDKMHSQLMDIPGIDDYETLAEDCWRIELENGTNFRTSSSYLIVGAEAKQFLGRLDGGLSSYLWRLKAIQNLAIALTTQSLDSDILNLASAREAGRLTGDFIERWVKSVKPKLGPGWGPITVLHALTDLGVACKPDIHLMRSAVHYGFFDDVPQNLNNEDIKGLSSRYEFEAVWKMIDIAGSIDPLAHDSPRTALREMDKVLMEGSRLGLNKPR